MTEKQKQIIDYTPATTLATGDKLLLQKADGSTMNVDYAELARNIITQYNAQTLAGSAQTVKSALDTLSSNSYSLKSGTNVASGADFNTYTTPGIYFVTNNSTAAGCANCPSGRAGKLIVEWTTGASTVLRQTYIEYVESANVPTANVYVRVSDNGASGWRAWQKQPTRAEVDTLNSNLECGGINEKVPYFTNVDVNTHSTAGIRYYANGCTNLPPELSAYVYVITLSSSKSGDITQIAYSVTTADKWYVRTGRKDGSTFSAWVKQVTRAEVDALNSNSALLNVGNGKAVATNSDFNNLVTPGVYYVNTTALAQSCSNIPYVCPGKLVVEYFYANNGAYVRQTYLPATVLTNVYTRRKDNNDNWTDWNKEVLRSEFDALNNSITTFGKAVELLPTVDANNDNFRTDGFHVYKAIYSDNRTNFPASFKAGLFIDVGSTDFHWQFCCPYSDTSVLWFRNYYQNWKEWKQLTNA